MALPLLPIEMRSSKSGRVGWQRIIIAAAGKRPNLRYYDANATRKIWIAIV